MTPMAYPIRHRATTDDEVVHGGAPPRRYDCLGYGRCLDVAVKRPMPGFACPKVCPGYRPPVKGRGEAS